MKSLQWIGNYYTQAFLYVPQGQLFNADADIPMRRAGTDVKYIIKFCDLIKINRDSQTKLKTPFCLIAGYFRLAIIQGSLL